MTEITESKTVYEEFKFFKNLYVTLNKSSFIIFSKDKNNNVSMDFLNNPADVFYILRGTLTGKTAFLDWIRENDIICKISLDDMKKLKETLKKNVVSVAWNENSFSFKTTDFELVIENNFALQSGLVKPIGIDSLLTNEETLDQSLLNSEIIEIFADNENKLTENRTDKKIIEVPAKKILSTLKNGKPFLYRGTNGEKNLVAFKFVDSELGISLKQIFATI